MIRFTGKIKNIRAVSLIIVALFALGSVTSVQAKKKLKQGDDSVLRAMCLGMEAMSLGNIPEAEKHFDNAILGVGAIWADNPEAKKARSLWYEESAKPFKGEPYERMMAYYYRGVLYLMKYDFGNAQACFRSSVMQDAFAEEDQNRADVALPLFLQGWALQAQGSDLPARDAYKMLKELRPDFEVPEIGSQPQVLVIAETGKSPRKLADGVGSFQMKFFRGKEFTDNRASYSIDAGGLTKMYPMEDIFWQASTRGGRGVDKIIEGKVKFAKTTDAVGSVLTTIADDLTTRSEFYAGSDMNQVGLALGVVGIGAMIFSAKSKPAVDVRHWDNLPDVVHTTTLDPGPGTHSILGRQTNTADDVSALE